MSKISWRRRALRLWRRSRTPSTLPRNTQRLMPSSTRWYPSEWAPHCNKSPSLPLVIFWRKKDTHLVITSLSSLQIQKQAEANRLLLTPEFLELKKIEAISTNNKVFTLHISISDLAKLQYKNLISRSTLDLTSPTCSCPLQMGIRLTRGRRWLSVFRCLQCFHLSNIFST